MSQKFWSLPDGAEMDVDFDGRFAHEDDDEIGGKKKAISKDRTA